LLFQVGSVLSSAPDYNSTKAISENVLKVPYNDSGFTRIQLMVKYKAATASGALDPEIVLKEHMLKGTFREWVLVDMTVKETVEGEGTAWGVMFHTTLLARVSKLVLMRMLSNNIIRIININLHI